MELSHLYTLIKVNFPIVLLQFIRQILCLLTKLSIIGANREFRFMEFSIVIIRETENCHQVIKNTLWKLCEQCR